MQADAMRTGLLAELPPAARELIAARARPRSVAAGEVIARQGDVADEMFVIRSGSCRVTLGDPSLGLVQDAGTLGPGDCFGEIAMLAESPRGATVTAVEAGASPRPRRAVSEARRAWSRSGARRSAGFWSPARW